MPKYVIPVKRIKTEYATLEVEADNTDEAKDMAVVVAGKTPPPPWECIGAGEIEIIQVVEIK